ncbi:MAG: xanthine dehydrogenase family protein molybdopterin-binding subunit [Rhodospirillaceae bacterium]|nr:xanthine dehydrogenase family protein molybdopterin-binding subunit [Rhodospirillaceae bacterium]
MTSGIGRAERRTEDERFLTGRGRYVDDLALPRQACGSVVRSPHAHAALGAIDTSAALAMPGVLAVYKAADLAAAGIGGIPCVMKPTGADGKESATPPRPVLAAGRVRMMGDPVAFVVAETSEEARAAAEAVTVTYRPLAAVTDAEAALQPCAPLLHDDAPGNLCVDWELGDRAAVEEALTAAAHRTSLETRNQRVIVCPMETRAALGSYDAGSGIYTLTAGTQGVHLVRNVLARHVLKVPAQRLRVVTPDVGGAFGVKLWVYPEYALVLFAARRHGRPVKWVAERGEAMASDHQGRDLCSRATLALDADGRFLALAIESVATLGAYASNYGPSVSTVGGTRALIGPYRTPALHVRVCSAYTNTAPTDAYRGAGRPENVYLLERLIDKAAHDLGLDPAELRRRNLVAAEAMPYRTPLGHTYDSGDFPAILEKACDASGWRAARGREAGAGEGACLRGIGLAFYVDPCGANRNQWVALRFNAEGAATLLIGSQSTGQGHETAYAQIVADRLGMPVGQVRVRQGDTDLVAHGSGSSGSRSLPYGGNAVLRAAEEAAEKGRAVAAALLEVREADVRFEGGRYRIAGTDRSAGFAEVVRASFDAALRPEAETPGLDCEVNHVARAVTFANGCHVCEVEIERATGLVRIVRYTAVDDFGRILNPLLAEGQNHGAVAQGIGQALTEHAVYDEASGQLLAGSFMDYTLLRADDLPLFDGHFAVVPCVTNPLGVKGCGEAGSIVSPAAVMNAVADALHDHGGHERVEMPATPEAIWRILHGQPATGPMEGADAT